MEDHAIIALYEARDEHAIRASEDTYGAYCRAIAYRILSSREDAEECVNDTWLNAWNAIPPKKPKVLKSFFGAITRNLALNRLEHDKRLKRSSEMTELMEEYSDSIPDGETPFDDVVALGQVLNGFLESLDRRSRVVFLQRYWYALPIKEIASVNGMTENHVAVLLYRVRKKCKDYLTASGIFR